MNRYQQTGRGLGSEISITIISNNQETATNYFKELWAIINAFENKFSRFITTSELSKINQLAGQKTAVSTEFKKLLKNAIEYSDKTKGLYNPLILPALQKSGYKGSWPEVTNFQVSIDFSSRKIASTNEIKIIGNSIIIPKNSALDFGGIGKGYLIDELSNHLFKNKITNFWISLGGDIVCNGFDLEQRPWSVAIANAIDNDKDVASITNHQGHKLAIATSGITKRRGKDWHHLMDPSTNKPAKTDILSATVATGNGVEADIYAKCLVLVGSESAKKQIKNKKYYASLLQISHNDSVKTLSFGNIQ
jgi:thiamine biosynthesis lipoprotein